MRTQFFGRRNPRRSTCATAPWQVIMALGISAVLLPLAVPLFGQGPAGDANRAVAAKPWPPERLPDGQPDVQGSWSAVISGTYSLNPASSAAADFDRRIGGVGARNPSRIVDPPDGQIPYQSWAAAKQKEQAANFERPTRPEHLDSQHRCLMPSVPRAYYQSTFRILQPPGSVVLLWDNYHAYRVIPLDGRPHIGPNLKLWMGDGRGHWEGNTLVIDTTSLNAKFRLSVIGDFFSDKAHVVERLTFLDAGAMSYEATIEDPTVFTRPWTMRVATRRAADEEMWEWACPEGERSMERMLLQVETGR